MTVELMHLDVPNANGNVYSSKAVGKAIAVLTPERGLVGVLGRPEHPVPRISDMVYVLKDLAIRDGRLFGNIEVIKPEADLLTKLPKGKVSFHMLALGRRNGVNIEDIQFVGSYAEVQI